MMSFHQKTVFFLFVVSATIVISQTANGQGAHGPAPTPNKRPPVESASQQAVGGLAIDLLRSCSGQGPAYEFALKAGLKATEPFTVFDMIACSEYISGIVDANAIMQTVKGVGLFCLPEEGMQTEQQMMTIVVKWLKNNPERLHMTRRVAVISAFATAFPCTP